jgi:hypothetical protein
LNMTQIGEPCVPIRYTVSLLQTGALVCRELALLG